MTARGSPTARANAAGDKAFRFFVERRHPGLRSISRLDPSACTTPTDASPPPSRTADARLGANNRFATPSSWSTHSSFSAPVVRRFHKALLAGLLDPGSATDVDAALKKLHLSECLAQSSLDALQIHGCYGSMADYALEREVRDALASRVYSGTSELQRNLIARHFGL